MRKLTLLFAFVIYLLITSCNPKVSTSVYKTYAPIDYAEEVLIIALDEAAPDKAELLGQVKIGDTGFSTKCGYDIVMNKAKLEAREIGGNAIKILEHKPPSVMGSTCHRIVANILKIEDVESYRAKEEEESIQNLDYAILNVYRYSGPGALIGYDLYLGDSLLCRVKNNFKTTLHIKKDGLNSLWAKTESKTEIPIDVKMGKAYYLRCGITFGAMVGRPSLSLVDVKTGKVEFDSFKAKNQ